MPVPLMVNICTTETITVTVREVRGPQIRPPITMIMSFGSYFKKSTIGIRRTIAAM